jgi:metallo-beta-lactamase family protein
MKIHFYGAARGVTGSKHLLEINGKFLLLDCGMFQGKRAEAYQKNKDFPFDAQKVDAMVLSHAHIDHCGSLPTLVKKGYSGKIYCTEATADIVPIMLLDSAHIQEIDERWVARHLKNLSIPNEPIYTQEDAQAASERLVGKKYHEPFEVLPGITITFLDAGHVLGASVVCVDFEENGTKKRLVFTGDIGRDNKNILRDPEAPAFADYLITESTYGDRLHDDAEKMRELLAKTVQKTIRRGGKIIVPAFAMQRTQELIYDLHILIKEKQIPAIPIFIDSPMAINITDVYRKHPECFDQESYQDFFDEGKKPFLFSEIKYTATVEESKAIKNHVGPCIIVSASGMCEAGRIRHHLRNEIEDPRNTILIIGYQAEYTLGRRLVERRPTVKIFDEVHKVRADIDVLNGYSGHADRNELLSFIRKIKGIKTVFVVHGEPSQSEVFAKTLRNEQGRNWTIEIPEQGEALDPEEILYEGGGNE